MGGLLYFLLSVFFQNYIGLKEDKEIRPITMVLSLSIHYSITIHL